MSFRLSKRDRDVFLQYLEDLQDAIENDEPGPYLSFKEFKREVQRRGRLTRRDPGGDINL